MDIKIGRTERIDTLTKLIQYMPEHWSYANDSQDVEAIYDYFGHDELITQFGGFFVAISNGDYTAVWGFYGIVPFNYKIAYEILWDFAPHTSSKPV